jgi:hypothetical protein
MRSTYHILVQRQALSIGIARVAATSFGGAPVTAAGESATIVTLAIVGVR